MHVYIHTHTSTLTLTYMPTYAHIHTDYASVHIHTRTHIYTHTNKHTHTQPGDVVVLATDGLYDNMFDEEIARLCGDYMRRRRKSMRLTGCGSDAPPTAAELAAAAVAQVSCLPVFTHCVCVRGCVCVCLWVCVCGGGGDLLCVCV